MEQIENKDLAENKCDTFDTLSNLIRSLDNSEEGVESNTAEVVAKKSETEDVVPNDIAGKVFYVYNKTHENNESEAKTELNQGEIEEYSFPSSINNL